MMIYCFAKGVLKHPIRVLFYIAIPLLILGDCVSGNTSTDTTHYFLAAENILHGRIDCLRLPVYPLLLKICSLRGGSMVVLWITIIQSLIFLLSIPFFYKLCRLILSSKLLSFCVSLCYITFPISGWCSILFTESISISVGVVLTYLIVSFVKDSSKSLKKWLLCILLTIFLLFLRPTFLVFCLLLPLVSLFLWVIKKESCHSFFLSIIPTMFFLVYCGAYYKEYGVFASSFANKVDYLTLRSANLWNPQLIKDPELVSICSYIDSVNDEDYGIIYDLVDKDNILPELSSISKQMISSQKRPYVASKVWNLVYQLDSHFPYKVPYRRGFLGNTLLAISYLFSVHLSTFLLVVLLFPIVVMIKTIKNKKIFPSISIICYLSFAYTVGILFAASNTIPRLLLPVLPLFFIILGYYIKSLCVWIKIKNRKMYGSKIMCN